MVEFSFILFCFGFLISCYPSRVVKEEAVQKNIRLNAPDD